MFRCVIAVFAMCICFLVLPTPPLPVLLTLLCTMWCTSHRHTGYGARRSVVFLFNWSLVNSFIPLILLFEYIHLCDLLSITAAWARATSTHTHTPKRTYTWKSQHCEHILSGTTKYKTIQSFSTTQNTYVCTRMVKILGWKNNNNKNAQ